MKHLYWSLLMISSVALADNRDKIAVIDTGAYELDSPIFCKSGHTDLTGTGIKDINGHGTMIANAIGKNIDSSKVCIIVIKWFNSDEEPVGIKLKIKRVGDSISYAIRSGAKFINLSLYGRGPNPAEKLALKTALKFGIFIAVAAGNENVNLDLDCNAFPACYAFKSKKFKVVANYKGFVKAPTSNYGGPVNEFENGENHGTSKATAVFLGKYIRGVYENKCINTCPVRKRLWH